MATEQVRAPQISPGAWRAYNDNKMSRDERMEFEADYSTGAFSLPEGAEIQKTEPAGFLDSVSDMFTGAERKTSETESLPDWGGMPEFRDWTPESFKAQFGTLLTSPSETVKVIKAQYPGLRVRQDAKGNYIMESTIDGKEYAIKPGVQWSDLPRAAAGALGFTPAARAASKIYKGALAAAGTQGVVEASQAATGGEVNPEDIAVAGATGGLLPALGRAVSGIPSAVKNILGMGGAPKPVTPPPSGGAQAAPPPSSPDMSGVDLADTTRKAAGGDKQAVKLLAQAAAPDKEGVDAARRLGVIDYLQPDHISTNQVFRSLVGVLKTTPGSVLAARETEALKGVAERADNIIKELGGTDDYSTLNVKIKDDIEGTNAELKGRAKGLYDSVDATIPRETIVGAPTLMEVIKKNSKGIGGDENLSPEERLMITQLGDSPTYGMLDKVRKNIGAAKRRIDAPFGSIDKSTLTELESALRTDQRNAILKVGGEGAVKKFDIAQELTRTRKGLEDDLISLFGKELDKSYVGGISGAIKALPGGDAAKFQKMIKLIPNDMRQEVVASGLATAFGKSAREGSINFSKYADWFEGLQRQKTSFTALMTSLPPEARSLLTDLHKVSDGIRLSFKERKPTGVSAPMQKKLEGTDNLLGAIWESAKRGKLAEAATTLSGMPGVGTAIAHSLGKDKDAATMAANKLVGSAEFKNMAIKFGDADQLQAAKILAKSSAFKNYVKYVRSPRKLSTPEQILLAMELGTPKTEDE